MKFLYKFLSFLFVISVLQNIDARVQKRKALNSAKKEPTKKEAFLNRTVIATSDLKKKNTWFLDSDKEFEALNKQKKKVTLPKHITIKLASGKLLINNKKFRDELLIINPQSGSFALHGSNYEGFLLLEMKNGVILILI